MTPASDHTARDVGAADGIRIRPFEAADGERTLRIFERAILETARSLYSQEQVSAWAGPQRALGPWTAERMAADTVVAELDGVVAGFTDLREDGYVDRLFVDPDCGRRGVAAALLDHVRRAAEDRGIPRLSTHASLVARPVFERAGFRVVEEETVERAGQSLRRFRMIADLG